jgi:alanine racemase
VRRRLEPRTALLLVAKADAYGHGAVAITHHAQRCGVDAVGVTTCAEALELRQAGIRLRTVILGPVFGEEAPPAIRAGIELCVPSFELGRGVERAAFAVGRPARVHVKVDTGMGRLGVPPDEALELLETVRSSPGLELAGVMTHFASTEGASSSAFQEQVRRFQGLLEVAKARGLLAGRDVWIHAANSAAVLSGVDPLYDAVRVGIAAYGVSADPALRSDEFRPILSVRTRIVHVRALRAGDGVGYGGTWTAARPTRIAVLPMGYHDGIDWRLGNRGSVLIRGRRAPMVGRISMDYTTVDVTDVPGVELGDTVTLIGEDAGRRARVEELAHLIGTIPYEITCTIGRRVTRIYGGGTVATLAARQVASASG